MKQFKTMLAVAAAAMLSPLVTGRMIRKDRMSNTMSKFLK